MFEILAGVIEIIQGILSDVDVPDVDVPDVDVPDVDVPDANIPNEITHSVATSTVLFGGEYRFDVPDAISENGNPVGSDTQGNIFDKVTDEPLSRN
jgi:hypothetical protein